MKAGLAAAANRGNGGEEPGSQGAQPPLQTAIDMTGITMFGNTRSSYSAVTSASSSKAHLRGGSGGTPGGSGSAAVLLSATICGGRHHDRQRHLSLPRRS
jgi:hypothetical protein